MATTIHVKRPARFPKLCVRCMSEQAEMRKFTDTAHGGVVSVTATLDIPVCDPCWKAARPWWIAGGSLLALFLASAIPFAIAQDKHVQIPKIIPMAITIVPIPQQPVEKYAEFNIVATPALTNCSPQAIRVNGSTLFSRD